MNKDLEPTKPKDVEITEQNIKFYRLIQSGLSIIDAYKGAGYEGKSPDAPYALFSSLKKRLLSLQESDSNINALQLRKQLSEVLSLPLSSQNISIKDKLAAIKLTYDIVEKSQSENNPNITAFVIKQMDIPNGPTDNDIIDVKENTNI